MARPFNGKIDTRHPRLGPGLGRVPRRDRRRRARRTCSSSSTTTPASAAWSPYGGRINMPTLDRLAANGLDLHRSGTRRRSARRRARRS